MSKNCAILIVNWNSWALLYECLQALSKQTYRLFRVFVVDNGSSQSASDEIFQIFPDMFFVHNKTNLGFAKANNQLLEQVKEFEWVAFLNPDTRPKPNWLQNMMNAGSKYPDYQFFASRLIMDNNLSSLDGDGDSYHFSGLAWRNRYSKTALKDDNPKEVFSCCAAASMYRTEILLKAGGFDEDFFCYLEDIDLSFRLRLLGKKCLLVPAAVVNHVGSATSGGQQSDFAVYHGHRNLVWTYAKNMPITLFFLFLPAHILLNLFSFAWFTKRGQGRVIFRSKWDAVKGLLSIWRKRRDIQTLRIASTKEIFDVIDKRFYPWR